MIQAGFELRASGTQLIVSNGNKLNEAQRLWIQQHKEELMIYLTVLDDPHVQQMRTVFDAEIIAVAAIHDHHSET